MFRDLINKMPTTLEGVVRFFGWSDAPGEASKKYRQMIAATVFGYALGLCRAAGYELADISTMVAEGWEKIGHKGEPREG